MGLLSEHPSKLDTIQASCRPVSRGPLPVNYRTSAAALTPVACSGDVCAAASALQRSELAQTRKCRTARLPTGPCSRPPSRPGYWHRPWFLGGHGAGVHILTTERLVVESTAVGTTVPGLGVVISGTIPAVSHRWLRPQTRILQPVLRADRNPSKCPPRCSSPVLPNSHASRACTRGIRRHHGMRELRFGW